MPHNGDVAPAACPRVYRGWEDDGGAAGGRAAGSPV